MGLSASFLDDHIAHWQGILAGASDPFRAGWPRLLFHHTPIENAVKILRSGKLLSRDHARRSRARDVGAPGVIDQSDRAHGFARLYFRPRTPTQFHIEGIRKPADCKYGEKAHCPILIMLTFDARRVLGSDGVRFSPVNMQTGSIEGATEDFFRSIPFEKVFHVGGFGGDDSIRSHRCAEVLVPSPMAITGTLTGVHCRSNAERTTLLHLLGQSGPRWEKMILVSDRLQLFEKRFSFVEHVDLTGEGIHFKLHDRHDNKPVSASIEVSDDRRRLIVRKRRESLPPSGKSWQVSAPIVAGSYEVLIDIEGHRAFQARLRFDDVPF